MYYKPLSKIEESIAEEIVDAVYLTCILLKRALKKLYYNLWCLRVFVAERLLFFINVRAKYLGSYSPAHTLRDPPPHERIRFPLISQQ